MLYPAKFEDFGLLGAFKYAEIRTSVDSKLEEFFKKLDEINHHMSGNVINFAGISLNQMFKKILLENLKKDRSYAKKNSRVLIVSDSNTSDLVFDQKLLFLIKQEAINVDSLSLSNNSSTNQALQNISYYSGGIYEHLTSVGGGMLQTLLQLFLTMPEDRRNKKNLSLVSEQTQSHLVCETCNIDQEKVCFFLSEKKEIVCDKCFKEKNKKF